MEVFKPNIYVTLSLSSTNLNSSHSSIEKSVNITNRLFESCLERHNQSEVNIYFLFTPFLKMYQIIIIVLFNKSCYSYFLIFNIMNQLLS